MQHRSFLELAAAASCENFSQDLHQVQYQCRSKAETRWWHGIKVVEFDAKISSQWFQLANLHFQCGPSSKRILAKFGVTSFRFMMVLARLVSVCTSLHWSENQCISTCFMNIPTLMSKGLIFFLRKYFIRPKSEITCNLKNNWAYSCFRLLSTRRKRKKCSTLPTKTRIRRLAGKSFRSFTFPSEYQRQRQRQSLYRQRQGFQELLGRVSSLSLFQPEHWSFCCFCAHRVISVSCENIFLSDNDQPASTAEASDPAQGDPTKDLPRVKSALAENLIFALLQ